MKGCVSVEVGSDGFVWKWRDQALDSKKWAHGSLIYADAHAGTKESFPHSDHATCDLG